MHMTECVYTLRRNRPKNSEISKNTRHLIWIITMNRRHQLLNMGKLFEKFESFPKWIKVLIRVDYQLLTGIKLKFSKFWNFEKIQKSYPTLEYHGLWLIFT